MSLSTDDQEILLRYATELRGMTKDEIDAWHLIYNEAKEDYEEADEIGSRHDLDYRNRLIQGWSFLPSGSQNVITTI